MPSTATAFPVAGYSRAQIALHWITAILVIAAFVTSGTMEARMETRVDTGAVVEGPVPHVMLGILVLITMLARLVLRLRRGAPEPATSQPTLRAGAIWGHRLLYVLLIALPLGGIAVWFGDIRAIGPVHGLIGYLVMALALGHALLALWHHYGRRDGTLLRMMRPLP